MTLEEIKMSDKTMLVPTDVSQLLGCDAHSIRLQAQKDPDKLGFNVVVVGKRTLIPRIPFIKFMTEPREVRA